MSPPSRSLIVNAENTIAQAPTGGMDQSAALRCRVGHALLLDYRDGSIAQVPFDLSAHGLSLLIVDSRAEHALVDGQYAQRRDSCEEAARLLACPRCGRWLSTTSTRPWIGCRTSRFGLGPDMS